jgi:hypothetical protein
MQKNTMAAICPIVFFVFAFMLIPYRLLHGFDLVPGDIGDSRLINWLLENVYQFFAGKSDSLWHPGFFWPFPFVIGFSENLFGSTPFYILFRLATGEPDTAFQLWFFFGYLANFGAAYYALRRLDTGILAATTGALIFAFALPTTAHAGHSQLHYRFGFPLAIVFYIEFLTRKNWRALLMTVAWLTWQFYCGIYMGFFSLLFLGTATLAYFVYGKCFLKTPIWKALCEFFQTWCAQSRLEKYRLTVLAVVLCALLLLLFYPYLQVSSLYGVKRGWNEISAMLPRPQSFLLADRSYFKFIVPASWFANLPMRHEHQMFAGMTPLLLAVAGVWWYRRKSASAFPIMFGMSVLVVVLTLYINGFSLWKLFYKLPLASAIRGMTRFDQILLFPLGYFSALAVDSLCQRRDSLCQRRAIMAKSLLILFPLLIVGEACMTTMYLGPKAEWRQRLQQAKARLPAKLLPNSVLFFAQQDQRGFAAEIDAMWVALSHGLKTLNGYSGISPPYYRYLFGTDCNEMLRRVLSYLQFTGKSNQQNATDFMGKVVPIGFNNCNPSWLSALPTLSGRNVEYSPEEFRQVRILSANRIQSAGRSDVLVTIANGNSVPITAMSDIGKPVRLSWRFLNPAGKPVTGWDTRLDLPFDIPAHGELKLNVSIDPKTEVKGGALQFSLVQEAVFWGHDIGVPPFTIPWN